MLDYVGRNIGRVARTRKDIPHFICGQQRHIKTDVCILDNNKFVLLVQEDKVTWVDLILGIPELESKVMPGITMKGASPIFYKVSAVSRG